MRNRIARCTVAVVAAGSALGLALVPAQAADEPLLMNWPGLLAPLPTEADESDSRLCRHGQLGCVDRVIREMQARFDPLQGACDHDAPFALAYLRTTEEYRRAAATPGFFADHAFVNHEDAVFAEFYFRAYDHWHRGDRRAVAPAWKVAFGAADAKAVSGSGDMLLGISAHINRDLPFVLATIGLADEVGASRKPDHDKVNHFLNRVAFGAEAAERLDPRMDDAVPGITLDNTATFQLVAGWREEAWRNAERLVAAEGTPEYAAVAASIEDAAAAKGRALVAATAYGPLGSSAERDAHCAAYVARTR